MYDAKADWHMRNATRYIGQHLLSSANFCIHQNDDERLLWRFSSALKRLQELCAADVRCCANVAFEISDGNACTRESFLRAGNRPSSICEAIRTINSFWSDTEPLHNGDLVRMLARNVLDDLREVHAGYEHLLATPLELEILGSCKREATIRRVASAARWLKGVERSVGCMEIEETFLKAIRRVRETGSEEVAR